MVTSLSDYRAMALCVSASHAATVSGAVELLRDIAEQIVAACDGAETVTAGAALGWLTRLDFIGNAVSGENDGLIEALRAARVPTILCSGSVVERSVPLRPREDG